MTGLGWVVRNKLKLKKIWENIYTSWPAYVHVYTLDLHIRSEERLDYNKHILNCLVLHVTRIRAEKQFFISFIREQI